MLDALRRENLSLLDEVNDLKNRLRVLLDSTTPPLPSSEERKNSKTDGKDTVEKPKQPRKEKTKKAAKAPKNQPAPVAIHSTIEKPWYLSASLFLSFLANTFFSRRTGSPSSENFICKAPWRKALP